VKNNSKRQDNFFRILVWSCAAAVFAVLVFLVGYILIRGIPHIKPSLFAWKYNSENVSMTHALLNTLYMVVLSLGISAPVGICTAIYLTEYAKRGSKLVEIISITTETLSGIPSIVYGLFGMLFFVTYLKMGQSFAAGVLTISIMILPLIIRTTEEAIVSVPDSFREGSYGLGAGKLRTVIKIILPSAAPGILSGIILAIGRVTGETAALVYTSGSVSELVTNIGNSGRTLAIHMWALSGENIYRNESYATAVVLLLLVVVINLLAKRAASAIMKGR